MKSYLKNYRQSPRKVRLVADLIRGKKVSDALQELAFASKRAGGPIAKLIESAVANAKNNFNVREENLVIKDIQVNKGIVLKRIMPRAQGSASRINKRTSHISITLEEREPKAKMKKGRKQKPAASITPSPIQDIPKATTIEMPVNAEI